MSKSNILEKLREKFRPLECNHRQEIGHLNDHFPFLRNANLGIKLLSPDSLSRCAILLALFKTDNKLHVLLTIRGFELKSFAGEICFPGGKFDPELDKSYEETAYREAQEEIGLERRNFELVSQLCPFISPVGHYIVPVVVLIKNPDKPDNPFEETLDVVKSLKACSTEVAGIFWPPLDYLLDDKIYTVSEVPFDEEKIKFLKKYIDVKPFMRIFVNFEERFFQNGVNPIYPFLYGINASILLLVILTIHRDTQFKLELFDGQLIAPPNVVDYVEKFKMFCYFMRLAEVLKKNYERFKSKL